MVRPFRDSEMVTLTRTVRCWESDDMTVYTFTAFHRPLGITTLAFGINDMGQIVGDYQNASAHGFLLSGGVYTPLDDPSATTGTPTGTLARGINNFGQIVGIYFDASGAHGFLRSGGNYITSDDPSATGGTFTPHTATSGRV